MTLLERYKYTSRKPFKSNVPLALYIPAIKPPSVTHEPVAHEPPKTHDHKLVILIVSVVLLVLFIIIAVILAHWRYKTETKNLINRALTAGNFGRYIFTSYCVSNDQLDNPTIHNLPLTNSNDDDQYQPFLLLSVIPLFDSPAFILNNSPLEFKYIGPVSVNVILLISFTAQRISVFDDFIDVAIHHIYANPVPLERLYLNIATDQSVGTVNNSVYININPGDTIAPVIKRRFMSVDPMSPFFTITIQDFNIVITEIPF